MHMGSNKLQLSYKWLIDRILHWFNNFIIQLKKSKCKRVSKQACMHKLNLKHVSKRGYIKGSLQHSIEIIIIF